MTAATSITVRVPLKIRRRPGRKTVVMPVPTAGAGVDMTVATRADPALVKALARAFRYQRLLDEGRYASISEMAEGEKIDRGYLGRLLRLAVLAPDLVETILDGRQGADGDIARLMEPLPSEWHEQRERFALSPHLEVLLNQECQASSDIFATQPVFRS